MVFIFCCVVLVRPNLSALAQDNPQYTVEEYDAYQAITGESDPAKKMDLITQFFKTYPKSTLKPNVTSDFQEALKNLRDAKKWPQVITLGKQFLTVVPDDAYTVAVVAEGYSETKNYQQFVVFGEATYKTNPSGNLAYAMAKAYKELKTTSSIWNGVKKPSPVSQTTTRLCSKWPLFTLIIRESPSRINMPSSASR